MSRSIDHHVKIVEGDVVHVVTARAAIAALLCAGYQVADPRKTEPDVRQEEQYKKPSTASRQLSIRNKVDAYALKSHRGVYDHIRHLAGTALGRLAMENGWIDFLIGPEDRHAMIKPYMATCFVFRSSEMFRLRRPPPPAYEDSDQIVSSLDFDIERVPVREPEPT